MSEKLFDVNIKLKSIPKVETRLKRISQVYADYADKAYKRAQQLVPVDTGDLKASMKVAVTENGFTLEAGAGLPDKRAEYQEYGFHHYQTGQFIQNPYLRPAIEEIRADLIRDIAIAIAGGRP